MPLALLQNEGFELKVYYFPAGAYRYVNEWRDTEMVVEPFVCMGTFEYGYRHGGGLPEYKATDVTGIYKAMLAEIEACPELKKADPNRILWYDKDGNTYFVDGLSEDSLRNAISRF